MTIVLMCPRLEIFLAHSGFRLHFPLGGGGGRSLDTLFLVSWKPLGLFFLDVFGWVPLNFFCSDPWRGPCLSLSVGSQLKVKDRKERGKRVDCSWLAHLRHPLLRHGMRRCLWGRRFRQLPRWRRPCGTAATPRVPPSGRKNRETPPKPPHLFHQSTEVD